MRLLLVLAIATVTATGTFVTNQTEINNSAADKSDTLGLDSNETDFEVALNFDAEDGSVPYPTPKNIILAWKVQRILRKITNHMPCGCEEYGIPPLAPVKKREAVISLEKGFLKTFNKLYRFRIDGLNKMKIRKFKLNVFKKYFKFDILIRKIRISAAKYETKTIFDAIKELGFYAQYEGHGSLDVVLKNVHFTGVLHYKLPIFHGSAKIKSLKTEITVEKCISNISGVMGEREAFNDVINHKIEDIIETKINNNQQISDVIEENVVPVVNDYLAGKDFWSLIDYIFSSAENENDPICSKCVPPADPWS